MPSTPGAGLLVYRLGLSGVEVLLFHRARLRPAAGEREPLHIPTWELDPPTGPSAAPGRAGLPFESRPRVKHRVIARRSLDQLRELAQRNFAVLTGLEPDGPFLPLGGVKMRLHRVVYVWACVLAAVPEPEASAGVLSPSPAGDSVGQAAGGPNREWAAAQPARSPYAGGEFLQLAEARARVEPQQRRFLDQLEGLLARPAL
jgi:predicted NUDIX family NTP pyrophosphohydrolase